MTCAIDLVTEIRLPGPERIWYVAECFRAGMSLEEVFDICAIDPWFLVQIEELVNIERELSGQGLEALDGERLRFLKRKGFADRRIAELVDSSEAEIRRPASRCRHPPGVQTGRYLCRRVCYQYRLHVLHL